MLASKLCLLQHTMPRVSVASKSPMINTYVTLLRQPITVPRATIMRTFADESRGSWTRSARSRRSLKEIAMQPAGGTANRIGAGAVAGGAVFGLGALCYYGLGLSSKPSAIDNSIVWPQYVKDRIRATYFYFGNSIIITAASAAAVFRSPVMINMVTKNSFLAIAASFAAVLATGAIARELEYKPGFGGKQIAWMVHCGVLGALLAPMCFLGGPLLTRAAWLTTGVVGGLSTVACCAPSDKFLYMGAPLAIGLGVVFAASLGSMFLPPTTMLGSGLYSVSIYGGLLLFSAFLLYDTQRIIRAAEDYPVYASRPFDPVNASIGIYLDTLNIFIRIASILANGGSSKKR